MPKSDAAHHRRRDIQLTSDSAVKTVVEPDHPETLFLRDILQGQCPDLNQRAELYRSLTPLSMGKLEKSTSAEVRLEIGVRVKALRESLGFSQKDFGAQVGASRSSVARWEIGADMPRPRNFANMAKLAACEDKAWWREKAGLEQEERGDHPMERDATIVPLYKGRIAAGHGADIEGEIENSLPLPRDWFAPGSRIIALKVEGESMAPLINPGYIVLVDRSVSDAKRLAGHMVAARSALGCTVKWLRRSPDTGYYQLVPQHVGEDYPIRTITPANEHEFGIIGKVVRWIGEPKPPRKYIKG